MKSLHENMAAGLLTGMLMITYICEGALLKKSSASDFLQKVREKRTAECFPGGCSTESSEAEEMMNADPEYDGNLNMLNIGHIDQRPNDGIWNMLNNGHAGQRANNVVKDPELDDGSGM